MKIMFYEHGKLYVKALRKIEIEKYVGMYPHTTEML